MNRVVLLILVAFTLSAQTTPAPRAAPPPVSKPATPASPDLPRRSPAGIGPTLDSSTELAVTGKVLLPNRQAPPEPVPLELKCKDTAVTEWTNAKGVFVIPTGLTNVSPQVSGLMPSFAFCEVRLRMLGFDQTTFRLDHVRSLKDLDLGAIVLRPSSASALTSFSATSAAAPESARRQFIRAMEHTSAREFDEAISALVKAVQIYPQYAAAHQLRGQLLERLQRRQAARAAYEKAAEIDPSYVKPLLQLAEMAAEDQDPPEALVWSAKVTQLAPTAYPNIHFIEGAAHFNLDQFEPAEKAARSGIAADPDKSFPRLFKLLGEILFRRNAYTSAVAAYRDYLQLTEGSRDTAEVQSRLAECDRLARILKR